MSDQLTIRVLGALEVLAGDRPVQMPPSKKTRALLAYLVLSDRPLRRERLCEIFWDLPDDPKGALRWSLSKIRRIVNTGDTDRLESDRSTVALNRQGIASDWADLREADRKGFDTLPTERLESLAATLRGDFLEDLALPRCPDFEAWRAAEATQYEVVAIRLLRCLVDRLADEPERAVRHALQLRAFTPDDAAVDDLIDDLHRASGGAAIRSAEPDDEDDAPEAPEPPPAPAQRPPAPQREWLESREIEFCTAPDGTRIAWNAIGDGPPILRAGHWLSHLQADMDLPFWRHWISGLSERNRLIRFDLRGNGLSDWDVDDVSFEAMVGDLETVADASGVPRFTLLGISQGVATSIAYSIRHPERVAGLILYAGYIRGWRRRGSPGEIAQREAIAVLMREAWGQDNPMFQSLIASMFLPKGTEEQAAWFTDLQRSTVSPENAWRLQHALGDVDVSDLVGRVTVPTLILHPTGDAVAPIGLGHELAEQIPGARLVELDTSNHIMMADEPAFARFLAEVRAFTEACDRGGDRNARAAQKRRELRRQVTVLDVNQITSTRGADLEPEVVAKRARMMISLARAVTERNGGDILDASEAGVTAVFGAREATETHAVVAARAALALQSEMARETRGRAQLRIALDSGAALVTVGGSDSPGVSSSAMQRARQLSHALCCAGIAVSDRVRAQAGGYIRLEPMHPNELPGLAGREKAYGLLALNSAVSRWYLRANSGLSAFVGREAELKTLTNLWRHVLERRGQAAVIIAEPGVGKSRLTHEFLSARATEGVPILEGGALEFDRDVAYSVVKRLLRSFFAITDADDHAAAGDKLVRGIERTGADAALETPLAFALELPVDDPDWDAMPSEGRARRIGDAVRELIARAARQSPLFVLLEDMHWADRESRMVVERLIDGLDRQRVMIVATGRPEFRHDWGDRSSVHAIRLHPLSFEEAGALALALLGSHPSVATLRRLLVERTDGTPLFIEETVRSLEESRQIVGGNGAYVAPRPIVDIETQSSVEPVIAARIDRLAPRERALLQAAAVIGRNSPHALLSDLSGLDPEQFSASIALIEKAEFLFELISFPDPEYTFKHALIHDVAYDSLLSGERMRLHAAALAGIERLYAADLADHYPALAKHAYRAEVWEKAAEYYARAADHAIERSAYGPASLYLERAIESLAALPETPERIALGIDLRSQRRLTSLVTGDYVPGVARLKEARDLAERAGDAERTMDVLLHLCYLHSAFGRSQKAIRAADEAREIARSHDTDHYAAEGDMAAASALLMRGDAQGALERLLPHHESFSTRWRSERYGFLMTRGVWYFGNLAHAHGLLGNFAEGARCADESSAIAAETRRPLDLYGSQYFRNRFEAMRSPSRAELARMRDVAEECIERAPFPFSPWLLSTWGYAQAIAGDLDAAIATLTRAHDAAEAVNMMHFVNVSRGLLAWVRALKGDASVRAELVWARRRAEKDENGFQMIRVLEAQARLEPDAAAALSLLEQAAKIAERAGYRPVLARLMVAQAARAEPAAAAKLLDAATAMFEEMGLSAEAAAARKTAAVAPG